MSEETWHARLMTLVIEQSVRFFKSADGGIWTKR